MFPSRVPAFLQGKTHFAPRRLLHGFDTNRLANDIAAAGVAREGAVAVMGALDKVVAESIQELKTRAVSREDFDKLIYSKTIEFNRLRNDLALVERNDFMLLKTEVTRLAADVEKLQMRSSEEFRRIQTNTRLELSTEKSRIRDEQNAQAIRMKEADAQIESELAAIKTLLSGLHWEMFRTLFPLFSAAGALAFSYLRDDRPVPPFDRLFAECKSRAGPVKTRLDLSAGIFTAQNNVSGRLTLTCANARNVKIGKISVHLAGFEHVLSGSGPNRATKRLFLDQMLDLQSNQLAPTEAIVPGPCDEDGMWNARQGSTVFDFSLSLASEAKLPSSFWNKRVGGVRYVTSATVLVKFGSKKPQMLVIHQEAHVVESVPLFLSPNIVPSVTLWAQDARNVGWLKSRIGEVSLKARCHAREFEDAEEKETKSGVWIAGGVGHVFVEISNESRRKVKTLKVSLIRRLKTFSRANSDSKALIPIHFSKATCAEKTFVAVKPARNSTSTIITPQPSWTERVEKAQSLFVQDEWSAVKPGESAAFMTEIEIPAHAVSIQSGLLVDVSYAVQVSIVPKGSAEIVVEIPVTILHSMSVMESTPDVSRTSRYKTVRTGGADTLRVVEEVGVSRVSQVAAVEEVGDVFEEEMGQEDIPEVSLFVQVQRKSDSTKSKTKEPLSTFQTLQKRSNTQTPLHSETPLDELDHLSSILWQQNLQNVTPPKRPPPPPPVSSTRISVHDVTQPMGLKQASNLDVSASRRATLVIGKDEGGSTASIDSVEKEVLQEAEDSMKKEGSELARGIGAAILSRKQKENRDQRLSATTINNEEGQEGGEEEGTEQSRSWKDLRNPVRNILVKLHRRDLIWELNESFELKQSVRAAIMFAQSLNLRNLEGGNQCFWSRPGFVFTEQHAQMIVDEFRS
ncbi:hypothetical protein HDU98_011951 [Podochytrium sp. JEL0797]|nr:hypothetical protein HDU98_011951 [Podochytrium sp. JEL0797]